MFPAISEPNHEAVKGSEKCISCKSSQRSLIWDSRPYVPTEWASLTLQRKYSKRIQAISPRFQPSEAAVLVHPMQCVDFGFEGVSRQIKKATLYGNFRTHAQSKTASGDARSHRHKLKICCTMTLTCESEHRVPTQQCLRKRKRDKTEPSLPLHSELNWYRGRFGVERYETA